MSCSTFNDLPVPLSLAHSTYKYKISNLISYVHLSMYLFIYVSVSELTLHTLAKASKVQTCFASINSNTAGTSEGNDSVLTPAARAALTLEHVDFNE